MTSNQDRFDTAAAVTRSLLGWGVVAGPFYVVVGLVLALNRPGFALGQHALSLLTLGDNGWLQRVNLLLTGIMVLAAAYGIVRAISSARGRAIGLLTGIYGVCLILSAAFLPDPVAGFPAGQEAGAASTAGLLHLAFGAIGFLALALAAINYSRWAAARQEAGQSRLALACAVTVLLGFVGGAALSQSAIGIALLWLAVLAGWLWLAMGSAHVYGIVPHPDIAKRTQQES